MSQTKHEKSLRELGKDSRTAILREMGARLATWKESKGWTNAEFSRRMGIYPQDAQRYLKGEYNVLRLSLSLAECGCDLNWLATGVSSSDGTSLGEKMVKVAHKYSVTTIAELEMNLHKAKILDVLSSPKGAQILRKLVSEAERLLEA